LITADVDKRNWIKKHISETIHVHTVMGWHLKKYYITSPNDILLDDIHKNIVSWTEHGGIGILHTSHAESLQLLDKYLK
jgi:hypothetical protein